MKNLKKITASTLALVLSLGLVACNTNNNETDESGSAGSTPVADSNADSASSEEDVEQESSVKKVTFYDSDGTTVLEEVEVEEGQVIELPKVEKEGYEFLGWFATPQMNHPYDFTQAITEDTNVYGGFTKYVEDTRDFYILGNGTSELLSKSEWGGVVNDDFKLEKQESDSENLYTITVDLEEGDEFQFAINDSWHNQRGFGYLDSIEKDGVEYFENSGGLGEVDVKKANIKIAKPGKYTFTLKTHPAEDYYDTENEHYTEDGKENFNLNPYDVITWTVE